MDSQRKKMKYEKTIKRALGEIIEEEFGSQYGWITIDYLDVSLDFHHLLVFVNTLGVNSTDTAANQPELIAALNQRRSEISRRLSKKVRLRQIPNIEFRC